MRDRAATALKGTADPDTINMLTDLLDLGNVETRLLAARALEGTTDPEASQVLIRTLSKGSGAERKAAAQALATVAGEAATNALKDALSDKDGRVRHAAVVSLERRSDPGAIDSLIAAISDTHAGVRLAAVRAMGDKVAVDPSLLNRVLETDEDARVRVETIAALGRTTSPEATAALVRALASDARVIRRDSVLARSRVKDAAAHEALRAALDDADLFVSLFAASALRHTAPRRLREWPASDRLAVATADSSCLHWTGDDPQPYSFAEMAELKPPVDRS